ncbi:hypothetical protein BKA69DRAFT_1052780 [Paraphysoderma sedebokerense]|nr:hypothetical protein BKA69DRAFT_1052780 [Paraphysoderma sedebokerense]
MSDQSHPPPASIDSPEHLLSLLNQAKSINDNQQKLHVLCDFQELLIHRCVQYLPQLLPSVFEFVTDPSPDVTKWVIDVIDDTFRKVSLSAEVKGQLLAQVTPVIGYFLDNPEMTVMKRAIACFTNLYPMAFSVVCGDVSLEPTWLTATKMKEQVLQKLTPEQNEGVKLGILKFMQMLALTYSEPEGDPRLLSKQKDVSLRILPDEHPFLDRAALLEEGLSWLRQISQQIASTTLSSATITAVANLLYSVAKSRPQHILFIVDALGAWTQNPRSQFSPTQIRSIERTIKNVYFNILRLPNVLTSPIGDRISEILPKINIRPQEIPREFRPIYPKFVQAYESLKRPAPSAASTPPAKKLKPDETETGLTQAVPQSDANSSEAELRAQLSKTIMNTLDIKQLPAHLVAELVVQSLLAISQTEFDDALSTARQKLRTQPENVPSTVLTDKSNQDNGIKTEATEWPASIAQTEESDEDEDELLLHPPLQPRESPRVKAVPTEISRAPSPPVAVDFSDSNRPNFLATISSSSLTQEQVRHLIKTTLKRILHCENSVSDDRGSNRKPLNKNVGKTQWMSLLTKLVGRVLGHQHGRNRNDLASAAEKDELRGMILEFVLGDFKNRHELALMWLYEEYLNYIHFSSPSYHTFFHLLLDRLETVLEPKDKIFVRVILDAPEVTDHALGVIKRYCESGSRLNIALLTLKELIDTRTSMRTASLNLLLRLCTHPDKAVRSHAILTAKLYYPDHPKIANVVQQYALDQLHTLLDDSPPREEADENKATTIHSNGSVAETPPGQVKLEDEDEEGMIPNDETCNWKESDVIRHIELVLALTSRNPSLLSDIFKLYAGAKPFIQRVIRMQIQGLIRAIGMNSQKLLDALKLFPDGCQTLVLRVLVILTEKSQPSSALVNTVKHLYLNRDLDAQFLIPIISGLEKTEILEYLPKLVSLLENNERQRKVFKEVITRILDNKVGEKGSSVISPAELLIAIHNMEDSVDLRKTLEAVTVCFNMNHIFKAEVLAVVMQQLSDQTKLPTLFMRTVSALYNIPSLYFIFADH